MDIGTLIIVIIIIIIIILLITNYVKLNQINAEPFTKNNYDLNSNNKNKLVMYYTDWCGISQQFKPIWERFCKETRTGVNTIAINCEKNEDKCKSMGIRGYPTVILHKANGENVEFLAPRTVENLEKFINNNVN